MKTFQKNVKALIFCNAIIGIIGIFSSTFLVAYFYNAANNYILTTGIYSIFFYGFIGIGFYFLGRILVNGKSRDLVFKTGIIFKCLYVFLILLFKEKISDYIILLGIVCGIGDAFYWSSFHVIKNDIVNSNKMYKNYTYFATLIGKTINITVPVILGMLIDYTSFLNIAFYMLILGLCALGLSFFIKSKKLKEESFCLKKFLNKINKNKLKYKPLRYVYFGLFAAGMRTIVSTLSAIIIMMTFGSNMSLGMITSVITVFTIVFLILYNRFEKFKKSKLLFIYVLFVPLILSIILIPAMSRLGVILYYLNYSVASTILDYSIDVDRYSVVKKLKLNSDLVEHHVISEIIIAIARLISFGIFCLIGLNERVILFKILLVFITAFVPVMAIFLRKIQSVKELETDEN